MKITTFVFYWLGLVCIACTSTQPLDIKSVNTNNTPLTTHEKTNNLVLSKKEMNTLLKGYHLFGSNLTSLNSAHSIKVDNISNVTYENKNAKPGKSPNELETTPDASTTNKQKSSLSNSTKNFHSSTRPPDVKSIPVKENELPNNDKTILYYVNISKLNIRNRPSMNSDVTRQAFKGDKIIGIGQEGIWIRTDHNDYVSARFLIKAID